jgi:hypothetical protein
MTEMITPDDIHFPVFAIATNHTVSSIPNMSRLQRCTLATFKSGWYEGLKLYDSVGNLFIVEKVERIKTYFSIDLLFLNPFIHVSIQLSNILHTYAFEDLKKIIQSDIKKYPEYWDKINYKKKILNEIRNSNDMENLFRVYSK